MATNYKPSSELTPDQEQYLKTYNFNRSFSTPLQRSTTITQKNTFVDDVFDHYGLSWLGQLGQSISNPVSDVYDPQYDPFEDITGYEQYAEDFVGIRNKEQADFLKHKINSNQARRDRLEESGRILPAFASAFLDPTTYIPVPLGIGMGFVKGAVKVGAGVGAITAATEPIRHALDPTSTIEETASMIGLSTLTGGLLGGTVGALTKSVGPKATKQAQPTSTEEAVNKYDYEQSQNEGITNYDGDVFIDPLKGVGGAIIRSVKGIKDFKNALKYKKPTIRESIRMLDPENADKIKVIEGNTGAHTSSGAYRPAFINYEKKTIRIDREYLKRQFYDLPHTKPKVKGVKALPIDTFRDADEYADFVMLHEYAHSYIRRNKKIKETTGAYENRVNNEALRLMKKIRTYNKNERIKVTHVSGKLARRDGETLDEYRGRLQKEREKLSPILTRGGMSQAIEETSINNLKASINSRIARYNELTNEVEIDVARGKAMFEQNKHLQYLNKLGIRPPENMFKTAEDWINFSIRKAVHVAQTPRGKLSLEEYNQKIVKELIDDIYKTNKAKPAETSGIKALRVFEEISNLGGTINAIGRKVKNKKLANKLSTAMLELIGDHGTMLNMNKQGIASPSSVIMRKFLNYHPKLRDTLNAMEDEYFKLKGIGTGKGAGARTLARGALAGKQLGSKVNNILKRTKDGEVPEELDMRKFNQLVGEYRANPKLVQGLDMETQQAVKNASMHFGKLMDEIKKEASNLQMFKNQNSFQKSIKDAELTALRINDILKDTKIKLAKDDRARLNKMLEDKQNFIKLRKDEIEVVDNADFVNPTDENYFTRFWRHDRLIEKADEFKAILRKHFEQNYSKLITKEAIASRRKKVQKQVEARGGDPETIMRSADVINAEVDIAYNNILEGQARFGDVDGVLGYGVDLDGQYKVGARSLLSRDIDIPNADVIDFIETDAEVILRHYVDRMAPAIEIHKAYGSTHMIEYLANMEIDLIVDGVDATSRAKIVNGFRDAKDNILGVLYSDDPTTLGVQVAASLRNLANLAFMGKVVFSALPELARPIMVNGFARTYEQSLKPFVQGLDTFSKHSNMDELDFLAPIIEGELSGASLRFVSDSIATQNKNFAGIYNKTIGQWLERPQQAFFQANLLTPYTRLIKRIVRRTSMHRFVEDSMALANGRLDKDGIARLASYGIDKRTANTIARMPIQKQNGTYFLDSMKWDSLNGGQQARRALREAIYTDINRTIVTPMAGDQLNMMSGVLRINDEGRAQLMDNPIFKAIGFQKTELGGKINNAFLGLLLQFYSWGIAANRKVLISMVQGRDGKLPQAMAGITAAVGMGMIADYTKNKRYYENKDLGEKIVRGVELSGVTALLGDANFMLETTSGGFFGKSIGARPLLGLDNRFGDADGMDAAKEFMGSGPSMVYDLINAFTNDNLSSSEKKVMLRKLIPLNNLWLWDQTFRDMYNSATGVY